MNEKQIKRMFKTELCTGITQRKMKKTVKKFNKSEML